MQVTPLAIPDVLLLEPRMHEDARGFFVEAWSAARYAAVLPGVAFVQDNHSRSHAGVVRGLHYQLEHTQGKLVRAGRGRIWDVAVDVRRASPTFGQWVGAELSDANHRQLWIPPGFAHGFVALTEADVLYKATDIAHPASERTLRWDDPAVGIAWPVPEGFAPILSEKDRRGLPLAALEVFP